MQVTVKYEAMIGIREDDQAPELVMIFEVEGGANDGQKMTMQMGLAGATGLLEVLTDGVRNLSLLEGLSREERLAALNESESS